MYYIKDNGSNRPEIPLFSSPVGDLKCSKCAFAISERLKFKEEVQKYDSIYSNYSRDCETICNMCAFLVNFPIVLLIGKMQKFL